MILFWRFLWCSTRAKKSGGRGRSDSFLLTVKGCYSPILLLLSRLTFVNPMPFFGTKLFCLERDEEFYFPIIRLSNAASLSTLFFFCFERPAVVDDPVSPWAVAGVSSSGLPTSATPRGTAEF